MFRQLTNLPIKRTVYFYADSAEDTMKNVLAALKDPKITHLSISFLEKEFMIQGIAPYFTKIMDAIYVERAQSLACVEVINRREVRLEKRPSETGYLEIQLFKKEFSTLKQEEEAKNTENNKPSTPSCLQPHRPVG